MNPIKFQETGRFGRITKNLKKLGFTKEMDNILLDSLKFPKLNKNEQTKYVENVMEKMEKEIGSQNAKKVMFQCGQQCCGKSWSNFAKRIWDDSKSPEDFFVNLNKEEGKYNTQIIYDPKNKTIKVIRTKCICGLINKGKTFTKNKSFCNCSLGHMKAFFETVFELEEVRSEKTIFSGDKSCEWLVKLKK